MYLFIIYKIIKHNDVQLTITFTFPGSAITLPFRQTLHLQNRVFDYSPERNIQDITSEFGFKASGRCPQSAESSYYWLKNKLWPHKILQIPNVGILSTIQWRFYNAKRFAVIPEWQMEKKLQFISDRIAGQLSKQSIKKQMETICRTFCVQIRSRRYERVIFCGNFAFQFCLFVVL